MRSAVYAQTDKARIERKADEIITEYLDNNVSANQLAINNGCSCSTITRMLREHNIIVRGHRKYALDENYFDDICTEEKAYIFGFLCADGSINRMKQTISMSLQETDQNILEKMRIAVKSEKPLEYIDYTDKHDFGYTYRNQYRWIMFSGHMCDELISKGMVERKSKSLKFPSINAELTRHFVRGYYDGNGSIFRHVINENNMPVTVTITSTESFCKELSEKCNAMGMRTHVYDASNHNGITNVFTISGKNVCKEFLKWIYEDSAIRLERKYQRYAEYYEMPLVDMI